MNDFHVSSAVQRRAICVVPAAFICAFGCAAMATEQERQPSGRELAEAPAATADTAPADDPALGDAFVAAKQQKFWLKIDWISGPPHSGDLASARLTFLTGDKKTPARVEHVGAEVLMPAHTHPPQQVTVSRTEALPLNAVEVAGIGVTMSGGWMMQVVATVDGVEDRAELCYEVP